jgi:outer membrane protein with beta-barrel domain
LKAFVLFVGASFVVLAARDATAQGFINPFVGTTLSSPTAAGSSTKPGYGVAFGGLGKVVGGETEIAYFPEVIDNTANHLAKNRVISFSGGAIIGPTFDRAKPYFAIGAGDLHLNVTSLASLAIPNPDSLSNDYFSFNVGGGVFAFFSHHVGVRGDVRYFRAFGIKLTDLATAGLALDRFNFWRASIGLAVKF